MFEVASGASWMSNSSRCGRIARKSRWSAKGSMAVYENERRDDHDTACRSRAAKQFIIDSTKDGGPRSKYSEIAFCAQSRRWMDTHVQCKMRPRFQHQNAVCRNSVQAPIGRHTLRPDSCIKSLLCTPRTRRNLASQFEKVVVHLLKSPFSG
ncbi:uncharacterized protein RCC_10139 [Ramularia collo-cygni]|uniref:Uncharacterized protein n=1 Tax=Ramularia collo-cygni TaxID=112498 RepID=A0A2D3VEZ3_9PEZI|nr:uncharacterized protein RCC_10139 [Ramularia collo-cygni]CZT24415.1 uncharacterized protein RCC_10139 [Ramularia collo-cygni]